MKVILVPGTHAWDGEKKDWYSPGSPFIKCLAAYGIDQVAPDDPFVWSTDLGGIGFGDSDLRGWRAAGYNLLQYCIPPRCPELRVPALETVVISHSHGLQVVLFAAARGLRIDTFVDVAGPVRKDMEPIARAAKKNIRRWVHIHAGKKDLWQWFGELGDGRVGIVREHPQADKNVSVPTADHGAVLREGPYFPIVINALTGRI